MVKLHSVTFVIAVLIQGTVSRLQETGVPTTNIPSTPYNYGDYEYGKSYDYGKNFYDDYPSTTSGYGFYDHTSHYEDDYGYYDDYYDENDYSDYYEDRNEPMDAISHITDVTDIEGEVPWVFIIVPVIQVDVFYVADEHNLGGDGEVVLPVETILIELGELGFGHFGFDDLMLGHDYDYGYDDYDYGAGYPMLGADYAHDYDYNAKASMYDSADELPDPITIDYPGVDHDTGFWVDWIYMVPPGDLGLPIVR